jgi:hypothetical protein
VTLRLLLGIAALVLALPLGCGAGAAERHPGHDRRLSQAHCDLYAAPDGSNRAAGTAGAPLRTPQRLADRLRRGQTGCLRGGSYPARGRLGYVLRVARGGITIRSAPGERATLAGVLAIVKGADAVTIADLDVHDRTPFLPARQLSVQVNAADTVLSGLDITSGHRKICVGFGSDGGYGIARRTVLRDSVVHDCGRFPNALQEHAVYVNHALGARIVNNLITDAAGFAIHLYPAAQRTLVEGNVMVGNGGGVIFAGEGREASSRNLVRRNVISGSTRSFNIASYWGGRVGTGNRARQNCLSSARNQNVDREVGFTASGNVVSAPRFRDPRDGDYRLVTGTRCSAVAGAATAGIPRR